MDGNPLRYIDPTGLFLLVACGWHNTCSQGNHGVAGGGDLEQWRDLFIAYWILRPRGKLAVDIVGPSGRRERSKVWPLYVDAVKAFGR